MNFFYRVYITLDFFHRAPPSANCFPHIFFCPSCDFVIHQVSFRGEAWFSWHALLCFSHFPCILCFYHGQVGCTKRAREIWDMSQVGYTLVSNTSFLVLLLLARHFFRVDMFSTGLLLLVSFFPPFFSSRKGLGQTVAPGHKGGTEALLWI